MFDDVRSSDRGLARFLITIVPRRPPTETAADVEETNLARPLRGIPSGTYTMAPLDEGVETG